MGLKNIQEEFVKLSLDNKTREKSFESDSKVSNPFAHLKLAINRHAFSLMRKRLGVVKSILRNTRMFLGEKFDKEFIQYARGSEVPSGIDRHRKDAIQFADWLIRLHQSSKYSPYLDVLLSHELQSVHMWMRKKRFGLKFYWRSPHRMIFLCRNSLSLKKARISPTIVIWMETKNGPSCYRWVSFSL